MTGQGPASGGGAGGQPLWFTPPDGEENRRRTLTRERVVAEALTLISTDGAGALSMRALATRLGVVPGALYRHVRSKEQLHDLILDGVLAEVDCRTDPSLTWAGQVTVLAQRLRVVLENHPGIAGLLKARDPLSPHSLALAEAFLGPLHAAGMPSPQAALAYGLIYDYTLGFALADRTSASEQRIQDAATGGTCAPSCARCPQTASPRWPSSASMYGPMIATNGHCQPGHAHQRNPGNPAAPPAPQSATRTLTPTGLPGQANCARLAAQHRHRGQRVRRVVPADQADRTAGAAAAVLRLEDHGHRWAAGSRMGCLRRDR
jgi:AcrR family transcriptional regulator